jgi:hypothetical protein
MKAGARDEGYKGGAMSFEEIGQRLGITRVGAFMLYRSAIRKLRRQTRAVEKLRDLAALKERRGA